MARKKKQDSNEPDSQPMSLTELQPIVDEFMKRYQVVKNEQELLKEDEKALVEEFSSKLDTKTLKIAMKTVSLKQKVKHKENYDLFMEILDAAGVRENG